MESGLLVWNDIYYLFFLLCSALLGFKDNKLISSADEDHLK